MIIWWTVALRMILRRIIMFRMIIIRTVVLRIIMLRVTLFALGGIEHAVNIKKGFFLAKLRKNGLHGFCDKVVI